MSRWIQIELDTTRFHTMNAKLTELDATIRKPFAHAEFYAKHGEHRVKILVARNSDGKPFAAGTILGKTFRVEGSKPSAAFEHLAVKMRAFLAAKQTLVR